MKRLLSVFLALILLFTMAVPAMAQETTQSSELSILTPDAFSVLFQDKMDRSLTNYLSASSDFVSYSYDFTLPSRSSVAADVELYFELLLPGASNTYAFELEGKVNPYALPSGITLWEGMLSGNATINGHEAIVLASFMKKSDTNDVQISITIQVMDTDTTIAPVYFSFGDHVLTTELLNELSALGHTKQSTEIMPSSQQNTHRSLTADTNNYVYLPGTFSAPQFPQPDNYLEDGVRARSHYSQAYYVPGKEIIAIATRTNTQPVSTYLNDYGLYPSTSVSYMKFQLTIPDSNPDTSHAWIAGIRTYSFPVSTEGPVTHLISALFSDLMGAFGIPTATIDLLVGSGLYGSVFPSHNSNQSYVEVRFGLNDYACFDTDTPCVGIGFQLDKDTDYLGDTQFNYQIALTYRTLVTERFTYQPYYYYTTVNPNNVNFTFDL